MQSRQRAVAEQLFCVQRDGSSRWRLTGYITPCQRTPCLREAPSLPSSTAAAPSANIHTSASVQGHLELKEQTEEDLAFHNIYHAYVEVPFYGNLKWALSASAY